MAVTPRQRAWVKYLGFTNLKTNMPRSHASGRGQFEGNANKDLSSFMRFAQRAFTIGKRMVPPKPVPGKEKEGFQLSFKFAN